VCTRFVAGVFAAVSILVSSGCSGGILGKQYEYEEDLRLAIDGSATLVVNASLPALAALRGLPVSTDPSARFDSDQIRTLFDTPVTRVTRVSRPWRRKGRRFVQVHRRSRGPGTNSASRTAITSFARRWARPR
jgi:hypothetical protein